MAKRTNERWIGRFKEVHGNKYDYSKTDASNKDEKGRVMVMCPKHGEFWIRPTHHANGVGYKKCSDESLRIKNKLTQEEFISKAKMIHGDKFSYDKVKYDGYGNKIIITCRKHGDFLQKPESHLQGCGCQKCKSDAIRDKISISTEEFITRAKSIHGNLYDYSRTNYISSRSKVEIICPIHGLFLQTANSHLNGRGCPKCSSQRFSYMTNEERETEFRKVHGSKYEYNWNTYVSNHIPMEVRCPIHGSFMQTPTKHLASEQCPKCNRSKLEDEIENLLINNNIEFIPQYKSFWLGLQSLDFYIPKYHVAIECQGLQHFKPIEYYGGIDGYNTRKRLDETKLRRCNEHGTRLLYYSNLGIEYPYEVFESKEKLLNEITRN